MGKGNVKANKRQVITKASNAMVTSMPDVCKTPGPGGAPLPIPYVNVARAGDLKGGNASVRIDGATVLTQGMQIGTSCGDEPGTLGGLVSGKNKGAATPITYASDVRVGGKGVVRNLDQFKQNGGNTVGIIVAG